MATKSKVVESISWRCQWHLFQAKTIEDMALFLREASDELYAMHEDGIVLDLDKSTMRNDEAILVAPNKEIAKKHGFIK